MPPTSTAPGSTEKEWPVELFRHTEGEGWQKQVPRGDDGGSSRSPVISVAPRKDCIVIPKLRQKFTLWVCPPPSTGAESSASNINEEDLKKERSMVVRRGYSILLISRRRTRAMVLKFQSQEDCLEFSDRFIELNPKVPLDTTTEDSSSSAPISSPAGEIARDQEQQEVVSNIARLLHDDDFLKFIHKLETYVANTTDGAKIFEALEMRDFESESATNAGKSI
jgi:hypothetical protein